MRSPSAGPGCGASHASGRCASHGPGWDPARLAGCVAAFVVTFWLLPTPAAAQTVRGTVTEAAPAPRPVGGAFVVLEDSAGARADALLTDPGGRYLLRAPSAGTYRVRVERVGYEEWVSAPLTLRRGEDATLRIELPVRPVELSRIDVRIHRECVRDPAEADAVFAVWEEARKALETAAWSGESDYRFEILRYRRLRDPETLGLRDAESERATLPPPPFESPPPRLIFAEGWVRAAEEETIYAAPDADLLLSEEFRRHHCFGLDRREEDGERQVGLSFEPVPGRRVPEIEGVFWLDEETAELRALEFRYVQAAFPSETDPRRIGGWVRFARLPDGPFFVREWRLRMPVGGRTGPVWFGPGPGSRRSHPDRGPGRLVAYQDEGGEVVDVLRGGRVVYAPGGGRVRGAVWDSLAGAPLEGAEVVLEGTAFRAVTGPDGVFVLRGVPEGDYGVGVHHPDLVPVEEGAPDDSVRIEEGEETEARLATPSPETLFRAVCPKTDPGRNVGAVVGRVFLGEPTGPPVAGARVEGMWSRTRLRAGARAPAVERERRGVEARSDTDGRFVLCGLPGGVAVEVRATSAGGEEGATTLKMTRRVTVRNVVLRSETDDDSR